MPPSDPIHAEKLIKLAESSFDSKLRDGEIQALRDSANPPADKVRATGASLPSVRASFIRWMVTCLEVRLLLDVTGLRVLGTIEGVLDLREIRFPFRLDFRDCVFTAGVWLSSAETGALFLNRTRLPGGVVADRLICRGPFFLRNAIAGGPLRLSGAQIHGDLDCGDSKFSYTSTGIDATLQLENFIVHGNIFFNNLQCSGEVALSGAGADGSVDCTGASFANSFTLDGVSISRDLIARRFGCAGVLRMVGARIDGDLVFAAAKIAQLSADRLRVKGDLSWIGMQEPENSKLILNGASVNNFRDDYASWPAAGNLLIDGLTYQDLTVHEAPSPLQIDEGNETRELHLDMSERIKWIRRQRPGDWREPQPWLQLARLLESKGRKRDSRHVLFELARVQSRGLPVLLRGAKNLLAWLEEQPLRIAWSILGLLILGSAIYWHGDRSGAMAPTNPYAFASTANPPQRQPAYPYFNAPMYTLENELPLIKLGQDDKWAPNPGHVATGWRDRFALLTGFRWMLILLGWIQAAALGAAVSARFKS